MWGMAILQINYICIVENAYIKLNGLLYKSQNDCSIRADCTAGISKF